MKNHLLYTLLFLLLCNGAFAQAGMWTWMNGDSASNSPGVFGTQGVPSPLNHPPGLYESCEWTDLQGNFWLFGGSGFRGDLWKYDPLINQWTWVKGTGLPNGPGNYGVKGVPALSNLPPALGFGLTSWVDMNGDFWMYGGGKLSGAMNDLWRYNIASNCWTWMHGDSTIWKPTVYGVLGVPSLNNTPGFRTETNAAWVDSSNNLWFFGGYKLTGQSCNDLWKYDILTNQWTWMKGANFTNQTGTYGIKGVPNNANVPGARWAYCHWKDSAENFWFFGGNGFINDMWRYSPATNIWTWMSGSNNIDTIGHYGIQCIPSVSNIPPARGENRFFWTDSLGNFWLYGGGNGYYARSSDLWMFNPTSLEWTFVSGDSILNQNAIYGSLGISSPLNKPGKRFGSVGWYHRTNNSLFLFGGYEWLSDLWRYQIDSNCPLTVVTPIVNLSSTDTLFCEKQCLNFFDLSTNNPTSWQWFFPGADSLTSSLQNPTNICYNSYGSYDVTLIACNAAGCDTLHLTNFITCYQNPTDSIYQSNDTLFSLPAYSYQWYEVTNGIIAGAVNQYFIPQQAGSYYCVATDSVGCAGSSSTIVITGITPLSLGEGQGMRCVPNPFRDNITITIHYKNLKHVLFAIKSVLGKNVFTKNVDHLNPNSNSDNYKETIDLSNLSDGIYFLEIVIDGVGAIRKIVKQ